MRQVWVICVVAFACSKKAEPPKGGAGSEVAAAGGSGNPAPVADAAAATPPPVDAAGSNAPVADDKLAAIPEAGILLATIANEKLVVAKLDRSGVKPVHELPVGDSASFAWLDDKTLAVKEPYGKDDKPMVMKVVDGKPTETVTLDEVWEQSAMLVTKSGEVWVERCTVEPDGPEPCTKLAYQRIWPTKATSKTKPKDVDAQRVTRATWARGVQRKAATVPAPPDVKLEKVKVSAELVALRCTKGAEKATYPVRDADAWEYGYLTKTMRWVLADPQIYELVADETNPVGQVELDVQYFVACKPQPLDGFINLGGPLWGEYKDADVGGTWTFRVGTTEIGTLDGGALRANR